MVSNGSVPWYNVPARPFPARGWLEEWLEGRYPFPMPPSLFARLAPSRPAGWYVSPPRPFPVKRWLSEQRR